VRGESYFKSEKSTLKISDNDIRMDEELQAKLFEPFYTARANEAGLASTLGILKAHNAEIEVKSEVGIGF
jgi:signal transduction histidine kinase